MSSAPFDPYHKWLGIPFRDQPAHHYRLLGIPLYEDDPQVVEAAADRQMAYVRKFQSGEHSAAALKILNEISRARLCLLKPDTKTVYDASLRDQLHEPSTAQPIKIDTSVMSAARPWWASAKVLGGAGILVILLVVAAVFSFGAKPQPAAESTTDSATPAAAGPQVPTEANPPIATPTTNSTAAPVKPQRSNQDRPLATETKADWSILGDPPDAQMSASDGAKSKSQSSIPGRTNTRPTSPNAIDLLARVDVDRHRIAGKWSAENQQLISSPAGMTRLGVPYSLPDEYDLTLTVERIEGLRELGLVFPVQGHPAQLVIDSQNPMVTQLNNGVTGNESENPSAPGQLLHSGRPVEIILQVRRGKIAVAAEGREILSWKGDPAYFQPSLNENFTNPNQRELMLISAKSSFRISKLEFSPPSMATPASSPTVVDLFALIDPARDSVEGNWKLKDGILLGNYDSPTRTARIKVPFQPTAAEYDLTISVTRSENKGSCGIGLQVQGQQCYLLFDTDGEQNIYGISAIDGRQGHENETTKRLPAPTTGLPIVFTCRVRQGAISIEANGEKIIDWKGDLSRLSSPPNCPFPDPKAFMLAVREGTFRFNRFTFTPVTGDAPEPTATTPDPEQSGMPSGDSTLQIPKYPTPDAAAQDAARKLVRDTFKVEYALARKADGKNLEAKINLAKSLRSRAEGTDDDPAACYVMLTDAAEFAADSGQLALAWEILVALGDRFDLPSLPLMERAAKAAGRFAKTDEDIAFLASMYVLLLDEAVRLDDFETAAKAAPHAATAVRKVTVLKVLKEQISASIRRVYLLRDAFAIAQPAREVLNANPDDESANLAWGRYVCFYKGDWLIGLPFLAKSSDKTLAELAKQEIEQPRELAALSELGDRWWDVAEQEKEPAKTVIRERAADAWQLALPLANGLQKEALESKVERIFKPTKFFETTGTGQGIAVAGAEYNPGPLFTVEFWVATQSKAGVLLSKRQDRRDSGIVVNLERGRPTVAGRSATKFEIGRSRQAINDGRWHHIAVVKLGNRLGLFVDGKWAAQTEFSDTYQSSAPWKVGLDGLTKVDEPVAKFCRVRFSKEARYLLSFHPEKNYTKDKGTLFIP